MSRRPRYAKTTKELDAPFGDPFHTMSRAAVVKELRRLAAASKTPLSAGDLPQGLWYALKRYFGSIEAAREATGVAGPERARRWSKEAVAVELRRLHGRGVRLTDNALKGDYGALLAAIGEHFGSIVDARRYARVPEPPPLPPRKRERWDEQRVVAEIEELHGCGESVASSKVPTPLLKAGLRYFGSWKDAVEAAGLDYDKVRLAHEPYDEDEVTDLLRALRKSEPDMRWSEIGRRGFYPAIVRLFGSLEPALERAGIDDWPVRERMRALSKSRAIAALRLREREGKSTARETVRREHNVLYHSGIIHYGEWRRFCEAARIDTESHNRRWTADTLLDALRARERSGLSLKPEDVKRDDSRLHASVVSYFGSYVRAVELVADAPWALTKWSPTLVIEHLKAAARGRDRLTAREAGGSLANACQKYFGSYSAACRAAGLEYVIGSGGPPKATKRSVRTMR